MIERIVATGDSPHALVSRVALGLVMVPHGAQKLLGLFGGGGFSATLGHLTADFGLPMPIAVAVILIESFGAVALVLGLFTRLAALGIGAVMIGAVITAHLPYGFFMNWFGTAGGEGFEYHLLALGLAVPLAIWGGGLGSIDRVLAGAVAARRPVVTLAGGASDQRSATRIASSAPTFPAKTSR